MSSRRRVAVAAALLAAAAGGVAFYRWRASAPPVTTEIPLAASQATPPPQATPPTPTGPTPLPDFFESPGLASRKDGPLRLYVSAAGEVPLRKGPAQGLPGPGESLSRVPILVALENDSYDKVDAAADLSLAGEELFKVVVSRAGPGGQREEVFSHSEPSADVGGWGPAERKTFKVFWPAGNATPGDYLISVTPAYGKREKLEIRTSLK